MDEIRIVDPDPDCDRCGGTGRAPTPRGRSYPCDCTAVDAFSGLRKWPERNYDAMIKTAVEGLTVVLDAERDGKWTPNAHDEALMHFLSRALMDRSGGRSG